MLELRTPVATSPFSAARNSGRVANVRRPGASGAESTSATPWSSTITIRPPVSVAYRRASACSAGRSEVAASPSTVLSASEAAVAASRSTFAESLARSPRALTNPSGTSSIASTTIVSDR